MVGTVVNWRAHALPVVGVLLRSNPLLLCVRAGLRLTDLLVFWKKPEIGIFMRYLPIFNIGNNSKLSKNSCESSPPTAAKSKLVQSLRTEF